MTKHLNFLISSLIVCIGCLCSYTCSLSAQFQEPQGISFGDSEVLVEIEVTDIDGDSYQDIIMSFWMDDKIMWMKNNGNATFSNPQIILNDLDGENDNFALSDLNNDGFEDLVYIDYSAQQLVVHYNQDGQFIALSPAIELEEDLDETDIQFFDFNEDGLSDIVLATTHELHWYENQAETVGFSKHFILEEAFQNPWSVGIADLDGDGANEIYAALSNFVRVFVPNDIGGYDWDNLYDLSGVGAQVGFTDINCDGYTDLIFTVTEEDRLFSVNAGPEGLEEAQSVMSGLLTVVEFEMGDLDGDGLEDFAFATAQDPEQNFLLQRCEEYLQLIELDNESFSGATSVEIADLDGDGELDVICCALYDNSLYWFSNMGFEISDDEPTSIELLEAAGIEINNGRITSSDPSLFPIKISVYNLSGMEIFRGELNNGQRCTPEVIRDGIYVVGMETPAGDRFMLKTLQASY